MARGQRKSIEEKIAAKEELIEALTTRLESEKRELEELCQEKRGRNWKWSATLLQSRDWSRRKWPPFCSSIWRTGRKLLLKKETGRPGMLFAFPVFVIVGIS